jgi:uncharacterized integral membrane protein (TIGR00697 family)
MIVDERAPAGQRSGWFVVMAVAAGACLITANTVAVKLVSIMGFVVPGGALVYPIAFILDDVITEVYGYRAARLIIWCAFGANLLFDVMAIIVLALPGAPYWRGQSAYVQVFSYTPRLLFGAFASYLVGNFANTIIMSRMKIVTRGRALWARTITSTVIGQGCDSIIFVSIAYAGTITFGQLLAVIGTLWVFKSIYEILLTPLTYVVVGSLKRREGLDSYDHRVNYNPFSFR